MTRGSANSSAGSAGFPTTNWGSIVCARDKPYTEYLPTLNDLIKCYWKPVYYYVCRTCPDREKAKDLTQEFFAVLVEKGYRLLKQADPQRRFRTFLKASLRNFLIDQNRVTAARKRRPTAGIISLEQLSHGDGDVLEAPQGEPPEKGFDRTWAACVLERVLGRLEAECLQDGLRAHFEMFREAHLPADDARPSNDDLAQQYDLKDGKQVANHVETVKRRFRTLLREELMTTVVDGESFEEELRELYAALATP